MTRTIATLALAIATSTVFAEGHKHSEPHTHDEAKEKHEAHNHGEHEKPQEHEGHNHGDGVEVKVPQSAQKLMGLKTAVAQKRSVAATMSLPGRFELSPTARYAMSSTISGKCTLSVKPLQKVRKGDLVFSVWSGELIAREQEIAVLAKRVAAYSAAGASNAELASQLTLKRSELEALLAGRKAANGTVDFVATEDGVVEAMSVADGAQVSAGDQIVTIVRPDQMRLKVFASPSECAKIEDGTPATCNGVAGLITHGYSTDASDTPLYVEFAAGSAKARCGERAVAEVVVESTSADEIAVPSEAIVLNGLTPIVFVKDDHEPDAFIATEIEPLVSGGKWTAVKGIHEGDHVVTAGAYELKLAMPSEGGKKAGHFHADGTFHESD